MTDTIDIRVDGETVELQVEELSRIERMKKAAEAPDVLLNGPNKVTPETIQFMIDLITEQTVLTEDLIEELPKSEFERLMKGVVSISFDDDSLDFEREQTDGFKNERAITFNDDGSVDLEDWE
jgi:hypothetical protein